MLSQLSNKSNVAFSSVPDSDILVEELKALLLSVRNGSPPSQPESQDTVLQLYKKAETKYQLLIEQIPAITFVAPLDHSIEKMFVSPQIEKILGFKVEEWIADPFLWYRQLHPDDRMKWADELLKAVNTANASFLSTYRVLSAHGKTVWMRVNAQLMRDQQGCPSFIQGVAFDVSELKEAEEAAKNSEQSYRNLIQGAADIIATTSVEGIIVSLNSAFEKITGFKIEDWVGKEFAPLVHPEDIVSVQASFERLAREGVPHEIDLRICTADGGYRYISSTARPIFENGKIVGTFSICRDITTRKEAEYKLAQAEKKFRNVLQAAPDAMIIVDTNGSIVLTNNQAEVLFGYKHDELLGKSVEQLVPERFRGKKLTYFKCFSEKPQNSSLLGSAVNLYALRKDGVEFPVEINLSPLETDDGVWVTGAIRDVTERMRIQSELQNAHDELEKRVEQRTAELVKVNEELSRSNSELQQFAYVASHDLQEPLRTVSVHLQLIERECAEKLGPDTKESLSFAVDAACRMRSLIEDLLVFSRVSEQVEPPTLVDMNQILKTVLNNSAATIKSRNARIHFTSLPTVYARPVQMLQVLQNLIGNALKFCKKDIPEVHVSAKQLEKEWLFSVRDNGIGIEQKYTEKIFTIFQRLHTREEFTGTGIGLAICKKIIERSGGKIWAESAPGSGSIFYFTLPV